jgi:hypothetical protein
MAQVDTQAELDAALAGASTATAALIAVNDRLLVFAGDLLDQLQRVMIERDQALAQGRVTARQQAAVAAYHSARSGAGRSRALYELLRSVEEASNDT